MSCVSSAVYNTQAPRPRRREWSCRPAPERSRSGNSRARIQALLVATRMIASNHSEFPMSITRLLTTALTAALLVLPLAVFALQTPSPTGRGARLAAPGPVPRMAEGHPDLHGIWLGGGPTGDIEDGLPDGETIPYTAL